MEAPVLSINSDLYDHSTFIYASQVGDIDLVRMLLLDPNIDPTAYENQAYHLAMLFKYHEIAELLMSDPRVMNSLLRGESIPLSPIEEMLKAKGWCKKDDFIDYIP